MPKPFAELPGCGLHLHLSLWDSEGKQDLSIGKKDDEPLSPLGRHFVAGLLAHAPALSAAGSPIVNSYKRLLPGSWSPAHVCWGVGNRAALVRVPSMGRRRHIEFRSGDNAANPFIFLTAALAAGLEGIQKKQEPPSPIDTDVGHLSTAEAEEQGIAFLPRTLDEALNAFEKDPLMAEALGPTISAEFLKVKRTELAAVQSTGPSLGTTHLSGDNLMINISALPVVDVHCHPFVNPGPLSPEAFVDLVSFPAAQ